MKKLFAIALLVITNVEAMKKDNIKKEFYHILTHTTINDLQHGKIRTKKHKSCMSRIRRFVSLLASYQYTRY